MRDNTPNGQSKRLSTKTVDNVSLAQNRRQRAGRKDDENLLVEFLVWTSPYLPIAGVLLVVCIFLNALWPR